MHLAIRPGPGTQFPFGNQFRQGRLHFRRRLRNVLF